MAVVTSDFLVGIRTNFRALFHREFQGATGLKGWQSLAMPMPSDGELNTYPWFGTVPQMQDVTHGPPQLDALNNFDFSLTNKAWQAAIEVKREAFERDQLGLITPRIGQLGLEAARHPGQLLFEHVLNNDDGFDGSAYFGDTRVIGQSANIDNSLAGTGTSIAQIAADLGVAKGQMRAFQDDKGRVMNLQANTIMIPPALEDVMWQVLNRSAGDGVNTPIMPAGDGGVFSASGYNVVINPFLTDVNDWFLFHVGQGVMKPFIWQTEKTPVLESDTNPNDRNNILNRTFLYSVYGRYITGMTDPRLGVRTTNS